MPAYPKKLATCVNRLSEIARERRAAQAALKKIKDREDALKEHLVNTFTKDELKSVRGRDCLVYLQKTDVPTVEDWDSFFAYARRRGNIDLIQRSVNTPAWRERLRDGKTVPGVGTYQRLTLQVRLD